MKQNSNGSIYDVDELPPIKVMIPLSFQHLCAMFGATVLVPLLIGFDTSVALVCSGVGTLTYLFVTGRKIPAYLGSSFAFIAPMKAASDMFGQHSAAFGVLYVAIVYIILALIIRVVGKEWLKRVLPPIVVGPTIMVIGLSLASTAVHMSSYGATDSYHLSYVLLSAVTLVTFIISSLILGGFFRIIPILIAILVGYTFAYFNGLVDFNSIYTASWLALPNFILPTKESVSDFFSWGIFLTFAPVALVTVAEHVGDQTVISKVIERPTLLNPGIDRSILGDGLSMIFSAMLGGPPLTTYGENVGVITITRVYSVFVLAGAACLAIFFGFVSKLSAFIHSIPVPVMGGISVLLFGLIASSGLRVISESKIEIAHPRNLVIASAILVVGIGGASIEFTNFKIEGMGLAAIVGIVLHLLLPSKSVSEGKSVFSE